MKVFTISIEIGRAYGDLLPVGNHSFWTFGSAGRHPLTTCHGRDAQKITPAANRRSVLDVLRGSQTESQRRTGPCARAAYCSEAARFPLKLQPIAHRSMLLCLSRRSSRS